MIDNIKIILAVILIFFILPFTMAFIIHYCESDTLKYKCENSYEDSIFKINVWCFVKYKWEYIKESLYEKAFEQNLNINK